MRLSFALLLPAIVGVAQAATASVQGFVHGPGINTPSYQDSFKPRKPVVLTPKQLRLVLAGQLDLSQYHALTDESSEVDSSTVNVINKLVTSEQRSLINDDADNDTELSRFLLVLRGGSKDIEEFKQLPYNGIRDGYPFSLPESSVRAEDLDRLLDDIKVQAASSGDATLLEYDLSDPHMSKSFHEQYIYNVVLVRERFASTILFINTDEINKSRGPASAFGTYSMPGLPSAKRQPEALMSESFRVSSASASTPEREAVATPLRRLPALCYNTVEACTNATNNCSGHGECYRKYGPEKGSSGAECFACGCIASYEKNKTTYWGGAACQKEDVSSQFWILAGFSVLLMGLVGWAIGMMFSIGNEKLPGVIGAGVAPKTR